LRRVGSESEVDSAQNIYAHVTHQGGTKLIGTHDPLGQEKQALHALADFKDKNVFEVGCGDGRMTMLYADVASSVLAFDPDADVIAEAQAQLPEHLATNVEFRVADMSTVKLKQQSYDVGVLAWSI
jgi:ubiquinone/menaquinone biosynthesis C-methylase UbiE